MEHLTSIVASLVTVAAMLGLYKLFPPRLQDYKLPPGTDIRELAGKYALLEIGVNLIFLVAIGAWTFVMFWVYRWFGELFARILGESEFLLTPLSFMWFFPAFPAALFLAALVVEPLFMRILGDRKAEYMAVQESRLGRLARLSTRHFYVVFFLPSLVIAYLFVDIYVIFRTDEIVIDPWAGLTPRHYKYTDVIRILAAPKSIAPNGNAHDDWRFVLYFDDGGRWNCQWDPSDADERMHKQIAEFVSQKSEKQIELIDVLQTADQ